MSTTRNGREDVIGGRSHGSESSEPCFLDIYDSSESYLLERTEHPAPGKTASFKFYSAEESSFGVLSESPLCCFYFYFIGRILARLFTSWIVGTPTRSLRGAGSVRTVRAW